MTSTTKVKPEISKQIREWAEVLAAGGATPLLGLSLGAHVCRFAERVLPGGENYRYLTDEEWTNVFDLLSAALADGGKKGVFALVKETLATEIAAAKQIMGDKGFVPPEPVLNPLTEQEVKPILFSPDLITVKDDAHGDEIAKAMEMPEKIHPSLVAWLEGFHVFEGQPCSNLISINFYVIEDYVEAFLGVLAKKDIPKPPHFWVMETTEGKGKPGGVLATIRFYAPEDRSILNQLRVSKNGVFQDLDFQTDRDGRTKVFAQNLRVITKLVTDHKFSIKNMSSPRD